MAFTMQHLLRLPPSMRCRVISDTSFLSRSASMHQCQPSLILRRTYAQAKPPPKPRIHRSVPTSPSSPEPSTLTRKPPPLFTGNAYADRLCHATNTILLYNSPGHTSYILTSYIFAAFFFVAGINTALSTKEPTDSTKPRLPWWARLSFAVGAISFATMGTIFILGPTKIIRRVWLLQQQKATRSGAGGYAFRIETKSPVPFRTGRTIETPIQNVSLDRDVKAQGIYWFSVPLPAAEAFTAKYLHPSRRTPTIMDRVRNFNASVLNAWPALKQNTKRMFLREGIAYVHIIGEGGQWKLDLQDAEVLDGAKPIEKLMGVDVDMARGVVPWMQRMFAAVGK